MSSTAKSQPTLDALNYPALLYCEGYIYIARDRDELSIHTRSGLERARRQDFRLADCSGSDFRVKDWRKVARPRSWKGAVGLLLGSAFAEPELSDKRRVSVETLASEVGEMMLRHMMIGNYYGDNAQQFRDDLAEVRSFGALFMLVTRAV